MSASLSSVVNNYVKRLAFTDRTYHVKHVAQYDPAVQLSTYTCLMNMQTYRNLSSTSTGCGNKKDPLHKMQYIFETAHDLLMKISSVIEDVI